MVSRVLPRARTRGPGCHHGHQMVLELRPAHDPSNAWGFVDTGRILIGGRNTGLVKRV